MMRVSGLLAAAVSLALFGACSSDSSGDDDMSNPDPNPVTPDPGPNMNPPDQNAPDYPPGPYGTTKGAVISNRSWVGYMDTDADADDDPFNEPPHKISLSDFYRPKHPESRLLVMIQSAGWCGPCQEEASKLPQVAAQWWPRGIRFMTAMWQDEAGMPGSPEYAKVWGTMFHQHTPVVADPDDLAGGEFGGEGIPFFILVDTKTMTIVDFPYEGPADLGAVFEQYASH
jgi:thiol-disulfide isomerase/thioredoxin